MPNGTDRHRPVNAVAYWATVAIGALLVLLGLVLGAGGIWLISLGGSWYYAVAGLGLILSGFFIMRGRLAGLWLYLLTYLFTLAWALWEVGLDGWAQVPRLVAPTIILILVLLTIPVLRRLDHQARGWRSRGAVAATLLLAVGGLSMLALPWMQPAGVIAQVTEPEEPAVPESTEPAEPTEDPATPEVPATGEPAPDASAPDTPAAEQPNEAGPAETPVPPLAEEPVLPEVPATEEPEAAPGARAPVAMAEVGSDWPAYGGSMHATRYSPLDQITADNVGDLTRIWEFRTGDLPEDGEDYAPETTPLKIGNRLFLCSALNMLIAVEASTGKEEWRYDPGVPADAIPYSASCRGVAYYDNPEAEDGELCATRVIEGTIDARLIAVDAELGEPCSDFGVNGQIDLEEGLGETVPGWYAVTSPPVIVRGIVVTGAQVTDGNAEDSPSGVIRGYDAVTGELVWAWDLGNPEITGMPPEGSVYTRGTPNMWTIASGDEELGHVYLPMGNSAVDYYGSNRSEAENEYATALVALDVTTGQPAWHFQTVHRDVWDYDLGSQPSLVDFPTDGGTVPAMVLASKQGDIFILDRRTGESLFPVEERPVPQGGVEPDYLSPTQPFSLYHTLAFPPVEEKDMWGMSAIDQLWCRIQFRMAHYEGIYTPPTTDTHWIQYPGYNGGNDWGSVAVDEERGILIANYNNMPNYNRLVPREEVDRLGVTPINAPAVSEDAPEDIAPQVGAPYGIDVNAGWRQEFTGLMCTQPPYGGIRAIDLATGETLWDRPLGTARANGPFGIPSMLPFNIGTPNNGGPVITAGGLVFIAAATDNLIRAIDIETGETVWQDVLPAGGQATPMVYEEAGRQFVAIFAGGHHFMETPIGDYLIAYGLPEE